MKRSVLPASDVYASCPDGGNILAYYKGVFEAAFVLLNPFIRPAETGAHILDPDADLGWHEWYANCTPVPWSHVQHLSGLRTFAEIDIALRTQIGGLRREYANKSLTDRVVAALDTAGMLPPVEGELSPLLHDKVLSFIQRQGYEWVWVGDEFCTERKLHWIEDLKKPDSEVTQGHCNVFTPDTRMLWTTHWDSHFSLLCSTAEIIAAVEREPEFEGFPCTDTTEVYWSVREVYPVPPP